MTLLPEGLLGDPLLDLGVGLLAASGPTTRPIGLGQALAAAFEFAGNQGVTQGQLAFQRQRLSQIAAQDRARKELISSGGFDPNNPQQLGLLAEASPELFFGPGGLLAAQLGGVEAPEIVRTVEAMGIPAESEIGRAIIQQAILPPERPSGFARDIEFLRSQDIPLSPDEILGLFQQKISSQAGQGDPLLGLKIGKLGLEQQILQQQIAQAETERAASEFSEAENKQLKKFGIAQASDDLLEAATRLSRLDKNTSKLLRPGLGFEEARRGIAGAITGVRGIMGADTREAEQALTDLDRLDTISKRMVFENLDILKKAGVAITDAKFADFKLVFGDPKATIEARLEAIRDLSGKVAESAKRHGVDVDFRGLEELSAGGREIIRGKALRSIPPKVTRESIRANELGIDLQPGVATVQSATGEKRKLTRAERRALGITDEMLKSGVIP